ncbi:MAG: hypothetical protein AAFN77_10270 [Planctomycetota bacterium]
MRSLSFLAFVVLTFCCWGVYGPVLHVGQELMGEGPGKLSSLRPFVCVGIAYFLIAVVYPLLTLKTTGEKGSWSGSGFVWSFVAGAIGAIGALGIILAFKFEGKPVYVMPLVFGLAPIVNTFVTMLMAGTIKQASPIFYIGILLVAIGAAGVLAFKPSKPKTTTPEAATLESDDVWVADRLQPVAWVLQEDQEPDEPKKLQELAEPNEAQAPAKTEKRPVNSKLQGMAVGIDEDQPVAPGADDPNVDDGQPKWKDQPNGARPGNLMAPNEVGEPNIRPPGLGNQDEPKGPVDNEVVPEQVDESTDESSGPNLWIIAACIGMTALCWGAYGPVLHKGQAKMAGSRLRPFLCVGWAYFAIAVILPLFLIGQFPEPGGWDFGGAGWSLLAGAAGAIGALGIIYAFNFGGKPIFVMPLVFGFAPVINTLTETFTKNLFGQVDPFFLGSLAMVIVGAVMVLVFAPRGPKPQPESAGA